MSKTSQRQAVERKAREDKRNQKTMKNLSLPMGGVGVVLERGVEFDLSVLPNLMDVDRFKRERDTWNARGFRFLLFIQRMDDRIKILHISDPAELNSALDELFGEFRGRRTACLVIPVLTQELMVPVQELCEAHILETSENADASHQEIKGLEVRRATDPIHGRILFLSISKELVEKQETFGVLRFIDSLVRSSDSMEKTWMTLRIGFDGFDEDPREVFEIPSVSRFLQTITELAPWWVILIAPAEYITWFSAICERESVVKYSGGTISVNYKPGQVLTQVQKAAYFGSMLLFNSGMNHGPSMDTLVDNLVIGLSGLLGGVNQAMAYPITRKAFQMLKDDSLK